MSMDWFQDVLDFHEKFGCKIGSTPAVPDIGTVCHRLGLIDEERDELAEALDEDRLPDIADAIGDMVYVLLGTAISYGIDLRPVWDAIQAANMAKEGGGTRADGKVLKPSDWQPPDIDSLLADQKPLILREGSTP